jgi:hypothetical protein
MEVALQDHVAVKAQVVVCLEIAPAVQDDSTVCGRVKIASQCLTVMVIK